MAEEVEVTGNSVWVGVIVWLGITSWVSVEVNAGRVAGWLGAVVGVLTAVRSAWHAGRIINIPTASQITIFE